MPGLTNGLIRASMWTQPDFPKRAEKTGVSQLLTVSFAHMSEMARWCVECSDQTFEEHSFAPYQHMFPAIASRRRMKRAPRAKPISDKRAILNKKGFSRGKPVAKRGGEDTSEKRDPPSPTSLPLFILTDGSMLLDAWEIATYCGLEPPSEEFRDLLEEKLAPLTRHLLYHYLLKQEHVMTGLMTDHNHIGFNILWSLGLKGYLLKRMQESFVMDNTDDFQSVRDDLIQLFDRIAEEYLHKQTIMPLKGGKYLMGGNKITQADVALASIVSPLVLPPELNNGKQHRWFKLALQESSAFQEEVDYWRNTVVGRYCMELYGRERNKKWMIEAIDEDKKDHDVKANNNDIRTKSQKLPVTSTGSDHHHGETAGGTTIANSVEEGTRQNGTARATIAATAAAAAANSNSTKGNLNSIPISVKKKPEVVPTPVPALTPEQQEQQRQAELNRIADLNLIMKQGTTAHQGSSHSIQEKGTLQRLGQGQGPVVLGQGKIRGIASGQGLLEGSVGDHIVHTGISHKKR